MTTLFASLKTATLVASIAAAVTSAGARSEAAPTETAYVAGGCFWCVEADFEKVQGVSEVVSGFSGGDVPNPTYEQVTGGGTGHYEAAEIRYDPDVVSYRQLMDLFFRSIDPLDAGGQFCDRGPSYRTAIFVGSEAERQAAEAAKAEAEEVLGREVVTPILGFDAFYAAGDYHQDYYKSDDRLLISSVGVAVPKSVAYERYREGCRRDERVRELWGDDAPFVGG